MGNQLSERGILSKGELLAESLVAQHTKCPSASSPEPSGALGHFLGPQCHSLTGIITKQTAGKVLAEPNLGVGEKNLCGQCLYSKGFSPSSGHFLWLLIQQPCQFPIDPGIRGSGPSNFTTLLCEFGQVTSFFPYHQLLPCGRRLLSLVFQEQNSFL